MTLPDVDTLDSLGGAKENYGPVEDPVTDRDATLANKAYANTAMSTRTATRAWVRFTADATTPTITDHDAVWGKSVAPTVSHVLVGKYLITWPATVTDEIDTVAHGQATHLVNIRAVRAFKEGSFPYLVTAERTSANSATVYIHTVALGPDDAVGSIFLVEML